MPKASMLDCTLREAPLDGLLWGDMPIRKIISGLENASVEIIELGFLKDTEHKEGSTSFQYAEELCQYLQHKKKDVLYAALVDYGRYDINKLQDYNGTSIDLIRVCFKHEEINDVIEYAESIIKKGYRVSIQHVDTMGYSDDEIIKFVYRINELKPYAYSIVDTFGAMYQSDLEHYINVIDSLLDQDIVFGFHGHNNLMLADSNAQFFANSLKKKRDIIVDSSLFGCGRSAGNAHTELMAQFLNKHYSMGYNIDEILDLIDTVITATQEKTEWGYSIPYFISGMHNAHTFNVKQLLKRHNLRSKDLRGIIEKLDEKQKKKYDYSLLEKMYVEYFDQPIDDFESVRVLSEELKGRVVLIIAPGHSISENSERIQEFIKHNNPIVIGVNNLIDGYIMDFVFYSGAIRYKNIQYQNYKEAGSPKLLITSNIKTDADNNELIFNYKSLLKFGWVNIDSSVILLLRLLQRCGINNLYAAGVDGYKKFGEAFYKNELDTGLAEQDRIEHTNDNLSMMRDMKKCNPGLFVHFLTESVYSSIFH